MSRDAAYTELVLALHGETAKAWLVSPTEHECHGAWLPKSLAARDPDPCGGFQRLARNNQRRLITIYVFSMPAFLAHSKGLMPSFEAAA